jgi:ABC-type bacteriocin/lantibiotic exporter with double-glycine peptidase domain
MIRNTTHEVDQFSLSLTNSLMTFTLDIIMIFFISLLLISVNTKITICVFLFLIFLIAVYVGIFKKKILQLGKNRFAFEANRISFIQKIFYSYREINLQNVSNEFIIEFNNLNKKNSKDLISNEMINFIFRPILEFLIIFTVLFSLFFLSPYLTNINNISIILVLSVISLARILPSITRILQSINNFKFFRPTVSSIDYYYNNIKEEINNRHQNIGNFKHKISFEDINFYYLNSQKILDNFNFEILLNKKTAIIGTSGSGKTTIANIVSGFINPNSGTIRIDDKEIESLNNIQWKKNIGYLSQDYYLLNSNIYENIVFPHKYQEKHKDKIDKIINSLNLHSIFTDDIRRSDYNIGENGNSLSGGQRQRVAIARIIFQNPQIIILDEFTAGLDNKNEIEVTNLVFDLFKDKTILIITHNKDIFKMVDQIIDLSKDDN